MIDPQDAVHKLTIEIQTCTGPEYVGFEHHTDINKLIISIKTGRQSICTILGKVDIEALKRLLG